MTCACFSEPPSSASPGASPLCVVGLTRSDACDRMKLQGYNDRVPLILVLLANELFRRGGLDTEGIFRVRALVASRPSAH